MFGGKNPLLIREMLESVGYPDRGLVGDIISGFRTTGDLPPTDAAPPKDCPAGKTLRDVLPDARRAQRSVLEMRGGSGDSELDSELHRITLAEEQAGWLSEPLNASEMAASLDPLWVPARRFGLRQNGKIRPIDDFSEWGLNGLLSTHEKIDLGGVDEVAGLAKWWYQALDASGGVNVDLGDGRVLQGRLAQAWPPGEARRLRGRTVDLSHAYKQWARHPVSSAFGVVVVWNPASGAPEARICRAMCFGETAAVWPCSRACRAV